MSGGQSRCLRSVMPLRLALNLFEKASRTEFLSNGVVITHPEDITENEKSSFSVLDCAVLCGKKKNMGSPL